MSASSPNAGLDSNALQAALQTINERRIRDGLAPLSSFGVYTPPPAPQTDQKDLLAAGQFLLEKRRKESGVQPLIPTSREQKVDPPVLQPSSGSSLPTYPPVMAVPAPSFPSRVKSWSALVLAASLHKSGGAIRAWEFARALDQQGSGSIPTQKLKDYLAHLQVPRSTRCRWVREAIERKLFRRARDGSRLVLAGLQSACQMFAVLDLGMRVEVDAREIVKPGWKGAAWEGYMTNFLRPVSRTTLEDLSGIPARTQRCYQKKGTVESHANYALESEKVNGIDGYREFVRAHAFEVRVSIGSEIQKRIAFRLPNTYRVPETSQVRAAGGQYRSNRMKQVLVCAYARQTAPAVVSECSARARKADQTAASHPGRGEQGVSLLAGDANRGSQTSQPRTRRYFDRYQGLKSAVKKIAKRRETGQSTAEKNLDLFELLPGGIKKRKYYRAFAWWRVIKA